MFDCKVVQGNKALIEILEEALRAAKAGELEGVVIAGCTPDGMVGWDVAANKDMPYAWARLSNAVANADHGLMKDGMPDWS